MRRLVTAAVFVGVLAIAPGAWAVPRTIYPSTLLDTQAGGTTNDCLTTDHSCSLRDAIGDAQDGDSVSLASPAPSGTYQLSDPTAVIGIGHSITIAGVSPRSSVIDQTLHSSLDQVFQIGTGVTVTISGVAITGGFSNFGGAGGAINNSSSTSTLILNNDLLTGNTNTAGISGVASGGAILNQGTLTVTDSTLTGNTVTSTSSAGQFAEGGAIATSIGSTTSISNSTITGNTAASGGTQPAHGGGIESQGNLTLTNVTLDHNTAHDGGGNVYLDDTGNTSAIAMTVRNSIVADGSAASGNANCTYVMALHGAGLGAESYNLENLNQCGFAGAGDRANTPSMLGTLMNNGGPTDTMALGAGSLAIDGGNPGGCTDPNGALITMDQRGTARGTPCDLGAYESASPPANASAPAITGTVGVGNMVNCSPGSWSSSPVFAYQWLRDGAAIAGATGASYTVASADAGHSLSCQVTASEADGSAQATSAAVAVPTPGGGTGGGATGGGTGGGGGSGGGGTTAAPTKPLLVSKINRAKHTAKFRFAANRASRFQCALVKLKAHKKKQPKPHYAACRSPKSYKKLARGKYKFFVRGLNSRGSGKAATKSFTI